jgi:DNA topoisomerase-2
LLTSDNYDDNEKKVTGGRNGYGAKLTNVFSKKFIVETADKVSKKKYTQVFSDNMSQKEKPKLTDHPGTDYTRVTFWPDLAKFSMKKLDDDITGLMMKRVYDIAGSTNKKISVKLNGKKLPIASFEDYVKLYVGKSGGGENDDAPPVIYERCSDRWEIAVSISEGSFSQVSFVNSINTIKGGTHIAHLADQLVDSILEVVKKKNRGGIEIKPNHVRNHLFVFANCLIENPTFDSQTKETMTLKQSKFGSTCEIPNKLMKQVLNSGIVDTILDWARAKQTVDMRKQLKGGTKNQLRVTGVPKLEDANEAGGKNSQDCTLILTEGDSAKALAVAGLSIVGRDHYGVFPLKGKVLNVRDANFKQVTENQEIQNLLKIVGLDIKREYDTTKGLRYGSIMFMTDQDHDGSHIKGLLINLMHHWWPSLCKMNGVLKEFVTPIVKVWKEGKREQDRKDEKCFFTLNEYEKWRNRTNGGKGWKTKYYKGLGTSTAKEAKEYFRDIESHELSFKWHNEEDGQAIDLAFNKKRADDRKEWINNYEDGSHVDHSQGSLTYFDFIHKELVQFAKYDVSRSVPSMVDGFKPSQRKVLFCSFKKKLKNDIKVAQFVGYISEQSAYHHGEVSLENTIINLAQNYVGSNNINLLFPSGQFGTRLQGGKDHAASRYIYTRLSSATRTLFHVEDDAVLNYLDDEGQMIEPEWYCPILPTVLVNGADGIGVGWSTFVPNYNPRDIIRNIRRMLRGEQMKEMLPWYKGFRGTIKENDKEPGKFDVVGCVEKTSDTTLAITELPVRSWTQPYKEWLEGLMPQEGKKADDDEGGKNLITDYKEYHTDNTVHFELTLSAEKMKQVQATGLEKALKLKSSISTTNMVLFDETGKIAKYDSALAILQDFIKLRRKVYDSRKKHLVAKLTREKEILSNKARFILMVVKGELELRKRKKADLLMELQKKGFKPMSELDAIFQEGGGAGGQKKGKASSSVGAQSQADKEAGGGDAEEVAAEKTDYDYLLGMNLWSLTYEKVEEIKKQQELKAQELDILRKTTIETMWDRDLEALLKSLDEIDALEEEEAAAAADAADGRRKKEGARRGAGAAKRRAAPKPRAGGKRVDDDDDALEDRKLLKRSLQEGGGDDGEVSKTTWGKGAPAERRNPTAAESGPADPASKAPRRALSGLDGAALRGGGGGRGRRAEKEEDSPPPPPPEEVGGAGLLSRLLGKPSTDAGSSVSRPTPLGRGLDTASFSSFSALGGGDDIFSYLRRGSSSEAADKPFSALDSIAPPGLGTSAGDSTATGASPGEDEDDDEEASGPKKKGKGKGKKAKESGDAQPAKKQKT